MTEIPSTHWHDAAPLFMSYAYSRSFFDAVLQGNHPGRIFVDCAEHPRSALLACGCEFNFLAGDAGNQAFISAARSFILSELIPPSKDLILIPCGPGWMPALQQCFGDFFHLAIARKTYHLDAAAFVAQGNWRARLPENIEVRAYDPQIAAAEKEIVLFWGSVERFLSKGLGFAVWDGNKLAAQCHAVMLGAGELEISVFTQEAYRRQGLARAACSAFIEAALDRGLVPAWSCWDNNEASMRLAESLGYAAGPDAPVCYVQVA